MRTPSTAAGPDPRVSSERVTSRRLVGLLAFCLPLSGGLNLSTWVPGYPGFVTVTRVVTVVALIWIAGRRPLTRLPPASRTLLQAFAVILIYGAVTLLWAPDVSHGINDLLSIALALATAAAIVILVGDDGLALRAFAVGVLMAGAVQVLIAIAEVTTGRHLSSAFGAETLTQRGLATIEELLGRVAWGSLGNPNDLGAFLLLTTAVFLSKKAYGLSLHGPVRLVGLLLLGGSVLIGLSSLADARAYRLGLALVLAMHLLDVLFPPGRSALRVPAVVVGGGLALAGAVWLGGSIVGHIMEAGASDALRLRLISDGLASALISGGFGQGLGTEKALLDTGAIPLNYHNVVAQLAAELGLIVAGAFLAYLIWLVISWAFATRACRAIGREAALARATLAVALLIAGATSSGVLESPYYWAFLAATALVSEPRRVQNVTLPQPGIDWRERPHVRRTHDLAG